MGMVAGQKKMAQNQIMPAVAQMWFMAVSFSPSLSNRNLCKCQCSNKFSFAANWIILPADLFEIFFGVNAMENIICHHDIAQQREISETSGIAKMASACVNWLGQKWN